MTDQARGRLTVTRKTGQSIQIGDDITVTVHMEPSRKGTMRVSIEAPRDVKVLRTELLTPKQDI